MCLIPPSLQKTNFSPDECQFVIFTHFFNQVVQNISSFCLKVLLECQKPTCIIMRMGNQDYLTKKDYKFSILFLSTLIINCYLEVRFFRISFFFIIPGFKSIIPKYLILGPIRMEVKSLVKCRRVNVCLVLYHYHTFWACLGYGVILVQTRIQDKV